MNKKELIMSAVLLFLIILSLYAIERDDEACAWSEYNTYSNSTQGYFNFLGRCYVKVDKIYLTKEVCRGGFLGIGQSCYESDESHGEMYSTFVCFKLKNGERC